jgi:hypothetical protein
VEEEQQLNMKRRKRRRSFTSFDVRLQAKRTNLLCPFKRESM